MDDIIKIAARQLLKEAGLNKKAYSLVPFKALLNGMREAGISLNAKNTKALMNIARSHIDDITHNAGLMRRGMLSSKDVGNVFSKGRASFVKDINNYLRNLGYDVENVNDLDYLYRTIWNKGSKLSAFPGAGTASGHTITHPEAFSAFVNRAFAPTSALKRRISTTFTRNFGPNSFYYDTYRNAIRQTYNKKLNPIFNTWNNAAVSRGAYSKFKPTGLLQNSGVYNPTSFWQKLNFRRTPAASINRGYNKYDKIKSFVFGVPDWQDASALGLGLGGVGTLAYLSANRK